MRRSFDSTVAAQPTTSSVWVLRHSARPWPRNRYHLGSLLPTPRAPLTSPRARQRLRLNLPARATVADHAHRRVMASLAAGVLVRRRARSAGAARGFIAMRCSSRAQPGLHRQRTRRHYWISSVTLENHAARNHKPFTDPSNVAVGTTVDPSPPAQIRTCRLPAYGSYLE